VTFTVPQSPPSPPSPPPSPPQRRVPGKGRVTRTSVQKAKQARQARTEPQVTLPSPGRPVRHSARWPARPFVTAAALYAAAIALTVFGIPVWAEALSVVVSDAGIMLGFVGTGIADNRADAAVTRYAALGVAAAVWFMVAVATGFGAVIPDGLGYGIVGTLPLAIAVRQGYKHAHREQPPPKVRLAIEGPKPAPAPPVAADPKALADFRREICRDQFADLDVTGWRWLGDEGELGFTFKVRFPADGAVTLSDLDTPQHRKTMARIWETVPYRIEITHDSEGDLKHNPSELRGVVTMNRVLPPEVRRDRRTDMSVCTYDHETGTIEIGTFPSGPAHWELWRPPRGGGRGGIIAGAPLRGKTGAAYIIVTQSSLATLEGQRICGWIVGSPQLAAVPVLRDQVAVYGSGPRSSLHALRMGGAILNARSEELGHTPYLDGDGQWRPGRGWSVPTPKWPLIGIIIDEWPVLTSAEMTKAFRDEVVHLAARVVKEGRKLCVLLIVITQTPDLEQLKARELREILADSNVLAVKCDESSGTMIGITADPSRLPDDFGYSYFSGVDHLPSTVMTLRHLEEEAAGEPDVFKLMQMANRYPLDLGAAAYAALAEFGHPGPGRNWSFTDEDVPEDWGAPAEEQAPLASPAMAGAAPVQEVLDIIMSSGSATWAQMMQATGLALDQVQAATAVLTEHGQIAEVGPGRFGFES
jgi:hypothetical protein